MSNSWWFYYACLKKSCGINQKPPVPLLLPTDLPALAQPCLDSRRSEKVGTKTSRSTWWPPSFGSYLEVSLASPVAWGAALAGCPHLHAVPRGGDGIPRVTAEVTTAEPQTWTLHKCNPRSIQPTFQRVKQGEPGALPWASPGDNRKGSGTHPCAEERSSSASQGSPDTSRDSGTTRVAGIHVP